MTKLFLLALAMTSAPASEWSAPVDVLHDFKPCVTYRGQINGELLVIQATLQPGWHTFTIDNERRAAEKLAGKPSLGIDQPTRINLGKHLELVGAWYQSHPKDFSKPELRWFSWGFDQQAIFAAKVRQSGPGPAQIGIHGQACTETTCKNIDITLSIPLSPATKRTQTVDLQTLVEVR